MDRREAGVGTPEKAVVARSILERSHDLARSVDAIGLAAHRARDIDRGEAAVGIPKKAVAAPGILERSNDLAGAVDPVGVGRGGAGNVYDSKIAAVRAAQKAVRRVRRIVRKVAHDLAWIVDPFGPAAAGTRDIDRGEAAVGVSTKGDLRPARLEPSHDLAGDVEPRGPTSFISAGSINGGECEAVGQGARDALAEQQRHDEEKETNRKLHEG